MERTMNWQTIFTVAIMVFLLVLAFRGTAGSASNQDRLAQQIASDVRSIADGTCRNRKIC